MPSVYQDAIERAKSGVFRPGPDSTYADGDDSSWMQVDWPAMTRRLEVDGRSVGVVDTGGDGSTLLFIHGLGGVWQNWLLNIPAFMGTHRCVAVDLPGFGLSEKPDECSSHHGSRSTAIRAAATTTAADTTTVRTRGSTTRSSSARSNIAWDSTTRGDRILTPCRSEIRLPGK